MSEYSEGIFGDGAAILKDGRPMTVSEIVAELNTRTPSALPEPVCDTPDYLLALGLAQGVMEEVLNIAIDNRLERGDRLQRICSTLHEFMLSPMPISTPSPEAARVPDDETAWLCEFDGVIPEAIGIIDPVIQYLGINRAGEFEFDKDVNKALRFARKEDAEAMTSIQTELYPEHWREHYKAVEHMWCTPLSATPPSSAVNGWQPISTAPKGETLLVSWDDICNPRPLPYVDIDHLENGVWVEYQKRRESNPEYNLPPDPPYFEWMRIPSSSSAVSDGERS